jgi:anti-sigma-K factor RskA
MISEDRQDQAIAYLFEELSPPQRDAFEGELQRDPELRAFVGDLRESLGLLAQTGPAITPPSGLKTRITAMVREENDPVPVPKMEIPGRNDRRAPVAWMALSAVLFLVALAAVFDAWTSRGRFALQTDQIASLQRDLENLRGDFNAQYQKMASLEKQDVLSQIRVVTLNPQAPALGKANAVVVWSAEKQQGLIRGDHLLDPGAGKDYQLWLIDPSLAGPVSAGLLSINKDGSLVTTFKPAHPVGAVAKFAISLEPGGGSATPRGPIVFVGG